MLRDHKYFFKCFKKIIPWRTKSSSFEKETLTKNKEFPKSEILKWNIPLAAI